jgi:hypothetical protein
MIAFASQPEAASALRLSEILSALSYALDLTEGQPEGHAVRTCLIGMRIAQGAAIPLSDRGPSCSRTWAVPATPPVCARSSRPTIAGSSGITG